MQEIAPNSLKRLLHACKWISNCFRDCLYGFWVNSQGSEVGRLWAKSLGYGPWFWAWWILVSAGNRSKLPETPPICLQMDFKFLRDCSCKFRVNFQNSEIGRFWAKSLGINRGWPIPTKNTFAGLKWFCLTEWVILNLVSFRAMWHLLLLTGRGRGGLGNWSWFPLPLLPSRAWTSDGEYLSPWLVKIARAGKVTVTGTFAFSCQKRTGCMLLLSVSECTGLKSLQDVPLEAPYFPDDRRSFSTRLKFPRETCRHPWCPKVVVARYLSNNSCCVCRLKNTLNQPRRNAGKWLLSQSECGVRNSRSEFPYFWPVVRIHLDLCVVRCTFWIYVSLSQ